jgi:hypothetical protein
MIFWQFWSRPVLAALVTRMREDERLNWLAHRLVKLQAAAGGERILREEAGTWTAEAVESDKGQTAGDYLETNPIPRTQDLADEYPG